MEWRKRTEPGKTKKAESVPTNNTGKAESVPTNNVIHASKIGDAEADQLPDWELAKREYTTKNGMANIRDDTGINVVNGFSSLSFEIGDIIMEKRQCSYQGDTGDPKSKQSNK